MTNKNTSHVEYAIRLGLSGKASAVYVALLEARTPITPKKLILETKLHRQYVYDALHELGALGLVKPVGEGRAVQYVANSPERVLTQMEEKRLTTLESVQNLLDLYNQSPGGMIEIIEGRHSMIANEFKVLREQEQGAYLDIIGGGGSRFMELFVDDLGEYEKLRLEKQCKIRYIGAVEGSAYNDSPAVTQRVNYEARNLPNITDAINICIRPESVSFNIFVPEVLSIRVKNKEATNSQRELFEVLWSVAKQNA